MITLHIFRGESGVATTSTTLAYYAFPSTSTLTQATTNIRAYKGSANSGSVQVLLYNGSSLIGTGKIHDLGSSYANYSDSFSGFSISGAQLRTKVVLRISGSEGAARYTQIWVDAGFGSGSVPPVTPPIVPPKIPPTTPPVTPPTTPPVTPPVTPPRDVTPPSVPNGVVASLVSSNSTVIKLSWNPSTDNVGGVGLMQYLVVRTDPSGNTVNTVVPAGTTSLTDSNTTANTKYSYTVSSEDSNHNTSLPSSSASVTTPVISTDTLPPNVPVAVATVVSPQQVTISWAAVKDNPAVGASGVAGYKVFRDGVLIADVQTLSTNDGPYSFVSGQSYKYTVLAYDADKNPSAQSAPSSVIPNPVGVKPTSSVCLNTPTGNKINTVIVISEENRTWSGGATPGVGLGFSSSTMPYLHSLAAQCTYFTQDTETNTSDNSAQQYVGAWTGYTVTQTHVSGDCTPSVSCSYTGNNIFRQFRNAGIPHREYVEGATTDCSASGNAAKHIPDLYMWDPVDKAACASEVLPLTQFSFSAPPTGYTFITPTLCNDGHDCSDNTVDTWLSNSSRLPALFNSPAYKSGSVLVEVWWDEDHPRPNVFACYSCGNSVSNVDPHAAGEAALWLNLLGAPTTNLGATSTATDIRPILGTP